MVMDPNSTAESSEPSPNAEVVVTGRNVEVPDHFRSYVAEKLSRLERFDRTIYLFDVETTSKPRCYDACAEAWPGAAPDQRTATATGV